MSTTTRSTTHGTFTLDHSYEATPADVFAAWSTAEAKRAWWGPPDDFERTHDLDFRVGGLESFRMPTPDGPQWSYDAQYHDIIPNERIVFSYQMSRDDQHASVSVTTVEFAPKGNGTQLTLTEYGVFLDGVDEIGARKHGTGLLLESLGKALDASKTPAV
jgi:uncharacterized protein YndB with AHSA1/START domain